MLRPLKSYDEVDIFFVVSDIECYAKGHPREGDLIAIDTAWREDTKHAGNRNGKQVCSDVGYDARFRVSKPGRIKHQRHDTWDEWWKWVLDISEFDKRFRTIFAHNGGGYDWVSFVQYSLHEGRNVRESISAACAGSKMVTLNITIEKGHSIHLCDSLQLLRSKLDDLAQIFLGEGKLDTGGKLPHEIYEENPRLFRQYHEKDTEILLRVMEASLLMMREKVARIESFGYTIGSTAMKVFRTIGLERDIAIPKDEKLKEFLRRGYRGGRVECFKPGVYEKVRVYDINSLYPYAMKSVSVPVSDRGIWSAVYDPDSVSVAEIRFRQKRRDIFPVLMVDGDGQYEGTGVYFSPEINLLRELDPECEIEFVEIFEFLECDFIFTEYVDRLYKLRLDFPNSPIALMAKFLLNSLYGKFGQHAEREAIVSDGDIDIAKVVAEGDNESVRVINARLGVCGVTNETRCNFEHVGIAGIITSFARVCLYRGLLACGMENVVYCDTDSVHTIDTLPHSLIGSQLGAYKLECMGGGVYAGKKLYGIREASGKEKIRVKGVSVGGKFGCKISFGDLERVVSGNPMLCKFHQFSTPLEIFSERGKAGVLRERKRTIRRLK